MKHLNVTRRLLSALFAAAVALLLPLAALAEGTAAAPAAAGTTITGTPYYGTDYVQFTLSGEACFYDVQNAAGDVVKHAYYDGTGTNNIGWEVGTNDPLSYTITAYTGRTAATGNVVATAGVQGVYAHLSTGESLLIGLLPAGATGFAPNNAHHYNGKNYDLTGGDEATGYTYTEHVDAYTGTLTYIDPQGNVLKTESSLGLGTVSVDQSEIAANGKTYQPTGPKQVTFTEATLTYAIYCREVRADGDVDGKFTATIQLVDEAGKVLASDVINVDRDWVYTVPQEFALTENTATTRYTLADAASAKLTLKPGDAGTDTAKTYSVTYKKDDTGAEVNWTIYLMNGVNPGERIELQTIPVAAGETATYTATSRTVNGETYVPVGDATYTYTYTYGDSNLVETIYYVPQGYTPENSYQVTVQYVNIANNNVLQSRTETVNPGADTTISCVAEFSQNGSRYIRLDGQRDTYRHSYYSGKRTYTIYYRDENDTLYQDTVITTLQTITTERTEETLVYVDGGTTVLPGTTVDGGVTDGGTTDGGTIVGGTTVVTGGTTGGTGTTGTTGTGGTTYVTGPTAGEELTNVTNDTTGQSELRNEEGVDTTTEREEILENETPLAGPDAAGETPVDDGAAGDTALNAENAGWSNMAMNLALLGSGALILVLLGLIVAQRKKNKQNETH